MRLLCAGMIVLFVAALSPLYAAAHSSAEPNETRVVMKVLPSYKSLLPEGKASGTGIPSVDAVLTARGVSSVQRLHPHARLGTGLPRLDLTVELMVPPGVDRQALLKAVGACPEVEWIEEVVIPRVDVIPDDPLYASQTHLPQILAPDAWNIQTGDSGVVIAIVDNGFDISHPDLAANVFTNEQEAAGLPGVDDDGNGYIDDVHGYDVAHNDPDPSPCPPDPDGWYDHGTLVAGTAAAVTNNAVGVAGTSWNCEFMPVKASYNGSPQSISMGYTGITYAAETGAHVINCSWGSFGSPSQYNQDVVTYAHGLGSLVIASAGNDPTDQLHYPSAYLNALSVTWVDVNDRRAHDATWGITVDVAAPGVNIRTTAPGGGYGSASGSSLSSPVAAGLAGLIRSWRPEFGPYELGRQLVLTADNIDAQNPGFEGLLGTGRINAYRAVSETDLLEQPYVATLAHSVDDSTASGNGDGWLVQGEEGRLLLTYRNYTLSPAADATITLSSDSPDLIIPNPVQSVGDIPADAIVECPSPFLLQLPLGAPAQRVGLRVTYEAAGGFWHQDTLRVSMGRAPVLLVDDDDGVVNVEEYYLTVLDSLGVPSLAWDVSKRGSPSATLLRGFPVVIWSCEWAFPSLDPVDRVALGDYLDEGGTLYLSGQDIGWDLCDPAGSNTSPEAVDWYNTYLHARYLADNAGDQTVEGVPGDVLGDGLSFSVYQPGRDSDQQFPSVIEPFGGSAQPVFRYEPGIVGAVHNRGTHGVVYTAFGFEAIASGPILDPVDHTGVRTEFMERVLDYLGPIIHTPLRDTEDVLTPLTVTARATGVDPPDSMWVYWRDHPTSPYSRVFMTADGDSFVGAIPAPGAPADIEYYLMARGSYYEWRFPLQAEIAFHVGPDVIPPTLSGLTQLTHVFHLESARAVQVKSGDNLGMDLQSARVEWAAGDDQGSSPLAFVEWIGSEAILQGSLGPVGSYGDTVRYAASIMDEASVPNTGYSDTLLFVYGLEDFETSLDLWDPGNGWGRQSGGTAHSGVWIVTDSPSGPYANNEDNSLTLIPSLNLSTLSDARISFWVKYGLEADKDFCHLEASKDGTEWTPLLTLTGTVFTWSRFEATLEDFVGPGADSVRFRFRLVSDESNVAAGVYIDDILLESNPTSAEHEVVPHVAVPTLAVKPVPSRGGVTFVVRGMSRAPEIDIYDLAGRRAATIRGVKGQSVLTWDGTGIDGTRAGSGVYLARLAGTAASRRIVLLR